MKQSIVTRLAGLALVPVIALAGCSRSPTDPPDHAIVVGAELIDRATGTRLAWTHGTGAAMHWDGGLPHLHEGEELAINVNFVRADGSAIQLGGDFTVRARLAEGNEGNGVEGIVAIHNHGDHVDLEAIAEGETEIVFMLWHGNHADFTTPAIEVEVDDH